MCPVKVRFYMIDEAGEEVDLSGAARFNSTYGTGTNEEIKKVLGTFDDFILTSLSLQTNGMNFLDKKQSERKKILSTFMDIEVFEQLETIARPLRSPPPPESRRRAEQQVHRAGPYLVLSLRCRTAIFLRLLFAAVAAFCGQNGLVRPHVEGSVTPLNSPVLWLASCAPWA